VEYERTGVLALAPDDTVPESNTNSLPRSAAATKGCFILLAPVQHNQIGR
jgi:hypothetical protein